MRHRKHFSAWGKAVGVRFLGQENGVALYAVDSGTYRFQSVLPE